MATKKKTAARTSKGKTPFDAETAAKLQTESLEDGKFWIVIGKETQKGKEGLAVTTVSDKDYSKMMSKFDVAKLGREIVMAHRC